MTPQSERLRGKAADVLRTGRREAALRQRPISPLVIKLAATYKRLADLDRLMREELKRAG